MWSIDFDNHWVQKRQAKIVHNFDQWCPLRMWNTCSFISTYGVRWLGSRSQISSKLRLPRSADQEYGVAFFEFLTICRIYDVHTNNPSLKEWQALPACGGFELCSNSGCMRKLAPPPTTPPMSYTLLYGSRKICLFRFFFHFLSVIHCIIHRKLDTVRTSSASMWNRETTQTVYLRCPVGRTSSYKIIMWTERIFWLLAIMITNSVLKE